jgi:hypothetical protein
MAKLRALGWLVVRRQGARGRVTEYGLDLDAIWHVTEASWINVGPDFDLRMKGQPETPKVVALPIKGTVAPPSIDTGSEWELAQAVLHAEDPALYGSWLSALTRTGRAGGRLTLKAPSRFHAAYVQTHLEGRILRTCQAVDADVELVVITQ